MPPITRHLKKPWVVMPLVALLALGGWFTFRPDHDAGAGQASSTDQVVQATKATMAKTVSADGTVAASDTDDLSFTASGTVTAVNVKAGDTVKAGQVLAQIDSASLVADVSTAEASVADAEAKLSDDQDADASDEQVAADESSLQSARDQLDAASEALDGAKLVATFDGTVATVNITEGEELASGGTGGTNPTGSDSGSGNTAGNLGASTPNDSSNESDTGSTDADISVITTGRFTVDLGFDDTDIANVEVGQVASVSVSASSSSNQGFGGRGFPPGLFPGAVTDGNAANSGGGSASTTTTAPATIATDQGAKAIVTEVGAVADASSGVASYPVTVAFKDTSGDFNVGATVTVAITYAEVDDAVQVPAFAVSTATDGTSTVKVETSSGTETRTVTTGLTSGSMVQIVSGLDAGESVVVSLPGRPGGTGGTGSSNGGGTSDGGPVTDVGPPGGAQVVAPGGGG